MAKARGFKGLTTKHLECRNLRHAWTHKQTELMQYMSEGSRGPTLVQLTFRCVRCSTQRIDLRVRRTGQLESRVYQYPKGYQVKDLKTWGGRARFNANVTVELIGRYLKEGG